MLFIIIITYYYKVKIRRIAVKAMVPLPVSQNLIKIIES